MSPRSERTGPKPIDLHRTLLIDGDVALYRTALKCEIATDWGNDLWTLHSDLKTAQGMLDCWIREMQEACDAHADPIFVLSCDGPTFRHVLNPLYKANRVGKRKPLIYKALRDRAMETYRCHLIPLMEADDVLGILATTYLYHPSIIVTIDKDLKGIPGLHYNPDHPDKGVVNVTWEEARRWHLVQSIAGDATDGYGGVPGLGVVRAERLLEEKGYTWATVVGAYEKAGLTETEALLNARMAKILDSKCYWNDGEAGHYWSPEAN